MQYVICNMQYVVHMLFLQARYAPCSANAHPSGQLEGSMVNELFIQGKATHKHVYGLPQIHVQSLFLIPVQNFLKCTLICTLGNSVLLRPVTSYRTSSRVRPCARWEIVSCYIIRNFLYNRHTAVMVMPHSSNSGPRSHLPEMCAWHRLSKSMQHQFWLHCGDGSGYLCRQF